MSLYQLNSQGHVSVHGHLARDTLARNWWDMLSSQEKQTLKAAKQCVFDLGEVERVDSAGLAWLINAIRDGRHAGVSITLRDVPEKLRQLAKISDVDDFLPVE